MPANILDQTLIVLVLYEMKLEESPAYQSLSRILDSTAGNGQLFVYDNSENPGPIPVQTTWQIHYRHDPSNPGVSRAYNQAHAWAELTGKAWLLLTDQDTSFPIDLFEQFQASVLSFPACQIFAPILIDGPGLLSPFKRRTASGKRLQTVSPGLHSLSKLQAVNSGLMVSVTLFGASGGYDERLRLDFSDFDFFRRAAGQTEQMAVVNAACQHRHSSSPGASLPAAIYRFKSYVQGSTIMAETEGALQFRLRALLHALRLSIRHRSLLFINTLFSGGR